MSAETETEKEITRLEKKVTHEMEERHRAIFNQQASFVGNGIYEIAGTNLRSTDTRHLFLLFVYAREEMPLPKERKRKDADYGNSDE